MSGETPEWVHKSEARRGWTWIIRFRAEITYTN